MEKLFKKNPNIFYSQKALDKLEKIIRDGQKRLHIIADFDMTITKNFVTTANGGLERNKSAHGMFMYYSKTPTDFIEQTRKLIDRYYPIEVSTSMTEAQKTPHMIDWWNKAHEMIVGLGFYKRDLTQMVQENPLVFRDGTRELFGKCEKLQVPMLIFSAGIADVIEEVLIQNDLGQSDLFTLLSNSMEFNESGKIVAFKDPLLHIYNKNESAIFKNASFSKYAQLIESRPNVVLIGDSLGDIRMTQGLKHDMTLSIGLLNTFQVDENGKIKPYLPSTSIENCLELKRQYLEVFDIVVTGDFGFDTHLNLILDEFAKV